MSFVVVAADVIQTAAADVAQIGSALSAGNLAAAIPTTELAAAGADEVSAAVAALFGAHAREYQAAAARAATYSERLVRTLGAAAASYAAAEAGIATSMQGPPGPAAPAPLAGPMNVIVQAVDHSPLGQALRPIINAAIGGTGGNQQSIVIDFVRHGQSIGNAANLIDTAVPGLPLTALGQQQATAIGAVLGGQGNFAGVFESQLTRVQQTALFAGMTNAPILPGLNEISAGIFDGAPDISPQGLMYLVGPVAWTLGFPIVPMLAPGTAHLNGIVFDQGFTNAMQTMYGTAVTNPVIAGNGQITDVAFSSEFAIEVGTLMNVNNPNPLLMLTHPLPNTGVVTVQGSPQGGWTMTSWDGIPVGPPTLPTKLFVDVRNLVTAPQFAAWNSWAALGTGDPMTVVSAVQAGVDEVAGATLHFPIAVTRDVVHAVTHTSLGGLSTELTGLI
ncbi:PE domain-containing protein [Mycobacterium interjectum]|uniref:PE domain-containing protein n=2 Tax=Mycobacterium interjectum TaxID=33895 RepID=UPI0008307862|nr:PE domain-containing protein [Mycobacterium interjectum]